MRALDIQPDPSPLQQICLSQSDPLQLVSPDSVDPDIRNKERINYRRALDQRCPRESWVHDCYLAASPYPIFMNEAHNTQLEKLHAALVLAITNILERWWTDSAANFPARMPLEPQEEDLLRWIENDAADFVKPIKECLGSWRPDFLVEEASPSTSIENFRICEINARFSFNGYLLLTYGQDAILHVGEHKSEFGRAADPERFINGLFGLFDIERPLYILKGEEHGHDVYMFSAYVKKVTGSPVIFVRPSELRLIPCSDAPFGKRLCRVVKNDSSDDTNHGNGNIRTIHPKTFMHDGELVEEVTQVGMELHQRELRALPLEMLKHISLRCFNDMRTIFLVHDKRMLGIVLQELESLVHKHGILTQEQAGILRKGIATTLLPGSPELDHYYHQCKATPGLKDDFLLKPVRSGKGAGILFGDELPTEAWLEKLERSRSPALVPGQTTYVVQRHVKQPRYDVLFGEQDKKQQNYLIGTYHSVNGHFLGIGIWRSGPGRICAVSRGGIWLVSVLSPKQSSLIT
ncbi:hypothetical protein MferCBS31731_000508 [Microsporum ferrugineum]